MGLKIYFDVNTAGIDKTLAYIDAWLEELRTAKRVKGREVDWEEVWKYLTPEERDRMMADWYKWESEQPTLEEVGIEWDVYDRSVSPPKRCRPGEYYIHKIYDERTLEPYKYKEVESKLAPIPASVAERTSDTQYNPVMRARPELIAGLVRWRIEAQKICEGPASRRLKPGEDPKAGTIFINSCYRRHGTSCGTPGDEYYDPCGVADQTDKFGHWTGFVVDVPTQRFRESCVPVLKVKEINQAAERAGFTRPLYKGPKYTSYLEGHGEWWHYRVKV